MPRKIYILLLILFAACARAQAGESGQAQPYEKIRYPTFADGRLQSLLEADQAEAYDLTLGTPRINLKNVVITLYDHSDQAKALTPPDQPLPVRMTITSDRGYFTRRPPEPGAAPEEIANLEGNVILRQMRARTAGDDEEAIRSRPSRLPPEVETEIHCEHAQWNNTLRKLNGDGEVEFLQEDSRITGTGFLYLADDEALNSGSGASNIKDWGGIVYIEHNARMEIDRDTGGGASGRTEITCTDTASYKLREREIQFERDVKIRRPGLTIEADILKVFLRREDDPLPQTAAEAPAGSDGAVLPGQVRSIVATIGNRPGSVVVTGYRIDGLNGEEVLQFLAKGGRADFDYDTNRITLTDMRDNRFPEVEFGADKDRITDRHIVFVFGQAENISEKGVDSETVLENLATSGGRGEVVLRTRRQEVVEGANVPSNAAAIPTVVTYRGEMNYNRGEGRIRFLENVALRRADLAINSESLDIRLVSDGVTPEPSQLSRILADTNVVIQTAEYDANAQRAEYDIYQGEIGPAGGGLDTLRLYGPPHPRIRDRQGNQITAPEIHMQRLTVGPGQRDQHLMVARGSASCDFITAPAEPGGEGKLINIKCERGMEYNQANKRARFIGQVLVTSDSPEDSYVLTSDLLVIDFEETPRPDNPEEYDPWVRRITAEGNARLLQDARVCEAINIIRDFPSSDPNEGDIYLQGALPAPGRPPQMAVYREETGGVVGAMFAAPLIKSTSRGDLIQANGPGQLSMPNAPDTPQTPEEAARTRSQIHFEGAASYEAMQGGLVSEARFWGGVRLVHPAESVMVNADEMDASFINEESASGSFGGAVTNVEIERIGRLSRVEGRLNVRLVHALPNNGQRVAVGDTGVVEFTPTGNILRLTADRSADSRRFVMARDNGGMTLRAPEMEVREAQGITRASGPGDLQIPASGPADGMSTPTRVLYGPTGSLVYNELGLNIRVTDNVRIVQPGPDEDWSNPGLDGICDRMEIALFEPPAANMADGEDALSRVRRMDATGNVILRVYAPPPPENPALDWLSRPGTTFFTRGDRALYDVPTGQMSISSTPPGRPELLLNSVESDGAPRRQRLRADRFVLHNNATPRRWNYEGELSADAIPASEPFEFAP